jgi:glycosyltransferase involved in cell wall biosynthesis
MALLEAMACGCAVVSTNTCEIPNVINDAENGYLCDTPDDMRQVCEELLDDPQKCEQIGRAARETIESRYGLKRFAFQWRSLLYQATHIIPRVREGGRPIQVNYNFGDA